MLPTPDTKKTTFFMPHFLQILLPLTLPKFLLLHTFTTGLFHKQGAQFILFQEPLRWVKQFSDPLWIFNFKIIQFEIPMQVKKFVRNGLRAPGFFIKSVTAISIQHFVADILNFDGVMQNFDLFKSLCKGHPPENVFWAFTAQTVHQIS